ncbi:phosphopantetheine binding protein [Kineothrix alysoides]|uniref:Phosphopantetheine binding protein n=1 Tax=Kineothrix alysoides TaxID=1469948 RepID=A0A4R1QRW7_9FIRM|nr:acyl carrier protein [Kineothrix alysoides]TCL56187.1 phosphopantetheine binding protein [Kineothrix alysoides]
MDTLFKIVFEISEEKNYQITEETDLITDYGFDSLKFILLISEIEEKYEIEFDIDDIDIEKLRSMSLLTQLVNKKIGEKDNV